MKMNSNINNHSAMTKDIPEIDDLTKGINDPDIMLSNSHQETSDAQDSLEAAKEQSELSVSLSDIEICCRTSCPILTPPTKGMTRTSVWSANWTATLPIPGRLRHSGPLPFRPRERHRPCLLRGVPATACPVPPGEEITFHELQGSMTMGKNRWDERKTALLAETYPVETTAYTAGVVGMSETAVKNKARKMGIVKVAKSGWLERAEHIKSHFHEKSFSEMGRELGISKMSVSRIAAKLGLRRTKEQVYKVSSRIRCEMIRRERRRVIFGLDPVTRIKVVSNRARVRLRSRLKGIGYIVSEERNILYYTVSLVRKEHLEHRGTKLGLRFLPFPQDTTTLFTAII